MKECALVDSSQRL